VHPFSLEGPDDFVWGTDRHVVASPAHAEDDLNPLLGPAILETSAAILRRLGALHKIKSHYKAVNKHSGVVKNRPKGRSRPLLD